MSVYIYVLSLTHTDLYDDLTGFNRTHMSLKRELEKGGDHRHFLAQSNNMITNYL